MDQILGLLVAFSLGVVLCGLIAHRIAVHWSLPWQTMLRYFGVIDERPDTRRQRPARAR
jgi:hypothetical protein